jgi:hypothetical protein
MHFGGRSGMVQIGDADSALESSAESITIMLDGCMPRR